MDHEQLQKAQAVEQWVAMHPRCAPPVLPTSGPRAHPIARVFGDVHALRTRTHTRKRLRELVAAVVEHLHMNGPWMYTLSDIYHEPAVTEAVSKMALNPTLAAAS